MKTKIVIRGDAPIRKHDFVDVWVERRDGTLVVHATDFSEYGWHARNGLCRVHGTPVTMTYGDLLREHPNAQVEIHGMARTVDWQIGGDFSGAARRAEWHDPVAASDLLAHISGG